MGCEFEQLTGSNCKFTNIKKILKTPKKNLLKFFSKKLIIRKI
jgi:hypothetical protein